MLASGGQLGRRDVTAVNVLSTINGTRRSSQVVEHLRSSSGNMMLRVGSLSDLDE